MRLDLRRAWSLDALAVYAMGPLALSVGRIRGACRLAAEMGDILASVVCKWRRDWKCWSDVLGVVLTIGELSIEKEKTLTLQQH